MRKRKTHAVPQVRYVAHVVRNSLCGLILYERREWSLRPTCLTCKRALAARKGK